MSESVVINGVTYNGVDTLALVRPDGTIAAFRPDKTGIVPDYWRNYLETKATEINTALNSAGENKSAFLWYTDAHWTTNYGTSPMLLKYLSKNTGMQKTFFGGDIATATSGELDIIRAWQEMVQDIPNHHSVIGNHDNQVTELETAEARGDFFIGRTGDMVMGTDATNGNNYYYIDNHIENTRYICLSTGRMWAYSDAIRWCIDALNNTPQGWHIIIISHLWLDNDYTNGGIIATPPNYSQSYLDMFDAYNYRLSGITSVNGVPYEFTNGEAKIEFIMGGHVHQDYDFTTAKGIPIILTECDAWQERDNVSVATKGTTTENCVYAVVADYDAKTVKIINVGRGDTRSVAIPDVATYTNQLPLAIDATGAIYNGIGYKPNTRISVSSGNFEEKTESGWYTTGFIKAKRGDVIRFRDCSFASAHTGSGTNRSYIYGAGTNYAFINGDQSSNVQIVASGSGYNPVVENGNIVQITIPTFFDSTYIRIVMHGLTADSIITVNEEIPD